MRWENTASLTWRAECLEKLNVHFGTVFRIPQGCEKQNRRPSTAVLGHDSCLVHVVGVGSAVIAEPNAVVLHLPTADEMDKVLSPKMFTLPPDSSGLGWGSVKEFVHGQQLTTALLCLAQRGGHPPPRHWGTKRVQGIESGNLGILVPSGKLT